MENDFTHSTSKRRPCTPHETLSRARSGAETSPGKKGKIGWHFRWIILGSLAGLFDPSTTEAQEQLRDFTRPILVFKSGGHHAPVRALVFTPEGRQLLSGGVDKVVNVWGLGGGRSNLETTIRPPIWRGLAGNIYAVALSPTADERGRRVLAVAGFGVDSLRGNIGLFYFPGSNAVTTGDHFAQLLKDDPNDPESRGHLDTVTSLAFSPGGRLLASGSNDASARIWDWKDRRTTAVLRGHVGPIHALAFTPDGTHLITGGRDGTLRLWDIDRPQAPVASARPYPLRNANDPLGVQINMNSLAVSGDGRWVVIGREDGRIIRYDARTLAGETVLSESVETIEALALGHSADATWLVTSSIGRPKLASDLPRLDCTIKVRSFPDGRNPREVLKLKNIAYACTFSPDDRTLAVAGGDGQGIYLLSDWQDQAAIKAVELKGHGESIWDVGLRVDQGRLAVGFSHDPDRNPLYPPTQAPQERPRYRGMILPDRELAEFDPEELSHASREFEGWTIRPVDQFHLEVARANPPGRTFRVALDQVKDRRWMCYSFIPPGPQHPRPTLAVGCDSGVWFYRLEDGEPTRLFSGHSGPVYCLAPSTDGRWLATGSSDQTVRLWTLAGCDVLPTLGAEFERLPDGTRVVKSVDRLGFGEAMGLRKGDVPRDFALAGKIVTAEDFFTGLEKQLPNTPIQIVVRRKVEPPKGQAGAAREDIVGMITTKRDGPALSFFLGATREWVLWMPSGYYDTSIAGDLKFLGWHLNQSTIFQPGPTDYLEIIKFEKELRQPRRSQPNKLDTLLRTADPAIALDVPFPPARPVVPRPATPEPRLDLVRDAPLPFPFIQAPRSQPPITIVSTAMPQPTGPTTVAPRPATTPPPAESLPPVDPRPAPTSPPTGTTAEPKSRASATAEGRSTAAEPRLDNRPRPEAIVMRPPIAGPLPPTRAVTPMPNTPDVRSDTPTPPATGMDIPKAPQPENPGPPRPSTPPPPIARVPDPSPRDVPRPRLEAPTAPPLVFHHNPATEQLLATLIPQRSLPAAAPPSPATPPRLVEPELPPLSPAEIVERGQPPRIEPRIEPLPNQRITTIEGTPLDPREVPPEKIAIGDLDADGKGTLMFDLKIDAEGRSPARSIDYRVDGRPIRPSTVFDRPVSLQHREAVKLVLAPGPHRFTVDVENEMGIKRTMSRDILVQGLPRPRQGRLKVLALAPLFPQGGRIPRLPYAARDIQELRPFFHKYLVSPQDGGPLYSIDDAPPDGASDTAERVGKAFEALKDEPLGEEDLVVVVIESHFLNVRGARRIAAADSRGDPPSPAISADELARHLGAVAKRKCKVLALIDGVHTASGKGWDTDIGDWVRYLRDEQNVIAFVASNSGRSLSLKDREHQAFAQAVLDSIRPPIRKDGPYLLDDFRDVVVERVLDLTRRQQQAECYVPEAIGGMFPLLNPQPTGR